MKMENRRNDEVLALNGEQLKTLAKLMYYQEANRMKTIRFGSEKERSKYLQESRTVYVTTVELIDQAAKLQQETSWSNVDPTLAELFRRYFAYVEVFFNTALRFLSNLNIRVEMISKVRAQVNEEFLPKMTDIKAKIESGTLGPAELEQVKAEASKLIEDFIAFEDHHRRVMLNRKLPRPISYSKNLKAKGISFEELVKQCQVKLLRRKGSQYGGPFERLDTAKKIEVYNEILVSAGRPSVLPDGVSRARLLGTGQSGQSMTLLDVALLAWDIYSSANKEEFDWKDWFKKLAESVGMSVGKRVGEAVAVTIAGTTVGTEAIAAIATAFGMEVVAVTSAFITLTSLVTGVGLAVGFGLLAGWLIGKIFESGGKESSKVVAIQGKHPPPRPVLLPKYQRRAYITPMPNGDVLAYQIAYVARVRAAAN